MTAAFALILALIVLIPVLAIVIDSPLGQALARRIGGGDGAEGGTTPRLEALESEVEYLTREVESLREETTFLRSLVEGREPGSALPPGGEEAGPPSASG